MLPSESGLFLLPDGRPRAFRTRGPASLPKGGRVVPLADLPATARELAADMLLCSPTSLAFTRKALYQGLDGTLETAMAFEGFALEKCYVSPEHKEYVAAFLEKRKPNFKKAKA